MTCNQYLSEEPNPTGEYFRYSSGPWGEEFITWIGGGFIAVMITLTLLIFTIVGFLAAVADVALLLYHGSYPGWEHALHLLISLGLCIVLFPWLRDSCRSLIMGFIMGAPGLLCGRGGRTLCMLDERGMYFPRLFFWGRRPRSWLFVPWENVYNIYLQETYGSQDDGAPYASAVFFSILASPAENNFFLHGNPRHKKKCSDGKFYVEQSYRCYRTGEMVRGMIRFRPDMRFVRKVVPLVSC